MTQYTLVLNSSDVFQLLDGLEERLTSWQNTLLYLEGEEIVTIAEECSRPDDARAVIEHYEELIKDINNQIKDQAPDNRVRTPEEIGKK